MSAVPRVFISFAQGDAMRATRAFTEVLRRLAQESETEGEEGLPEITGFDRDSISHGEDWRKEIEEAIRESELVLAYWGPNATGSAFLSYELGLADGLGKEVTIIIDEGSPDVPFELADKKLMRLGGDPAIDVDRVVTAGENG